VRKCEPLKMIATRFLHTSSTAEDACLLVLIFNGYGGSR
jgi:hypothetical protein